MGSRSDHSGITRSILGVLSLAVVACDAPGRVGQGSSQPSAPQTSASSEVADATSATPPLPVERCSLAPKKLDFVRWSPDSRVLLTAGAPQAKETEPAKPIEDGSVDGWDLVKGERAFSFHLGAAKPETRTPVVGFSPDNKHAFCAGIYDGIGQSIVAWDLTSGATRFTSSGVAFPAGVEVSHDGKTLAVVGVAAEVRLLELPSLRERASTPYSDGHQEATIAFTPDDKVLLHAVGNGSVELLESGKLKLTKSLAGVPAISRDGSRVALFGKRWSGIADAVSGKRLATFAGLSKLDDADFFNAMAAFSPDGKRVAFLKRGDKQVLVFDADGGKQAGVFATADDTDFFQWSRDSKVMLAGTQAFDAETFKPGAKLPLGVAFGFANNSMLFRRDGEKVVELEPLTGKPTGRAWDLPGSTDVEIETSPDDAFLSYVPAGGATVRLVRVADGAAVELGVVWLDGAQRGFVVASDGRYDGPAEAAACAPRPAASAIKAQPGLLRAFIGKR